MNSPQISTVINTLQEKIIKDIISLSEEATDEIERKILIERIKNYSKIKKILIEDMTDECVFDLHFVLKKIMKLDVSMNTCK